MIRAGDMRHRVRIESRSTTQDSAGEPALTWALVAERWASVEPLVGKEYFAAAERHAKVSTRFRLRYMAGILPNMRIVWSDRVFDIVDVVQPNGINYELVLMANEIVGEAP